SWGRGLFKQSWGGLSATTALQSLKGAAEGLQGLREKVERSFDEALADRGERRMVLDRPVKMTRLRGTPTSRSQRTGKSKIIVTPRDKIGQSSDSRKKGSQNSKKASRSNKSSLRRRSCSRRGFRRFGSWSRKG
ncbi:unnamed protein product, partial [Effrenium voratum]